MRARKLNAGRSGALGGFGRRTNIVNSGAAQPEALLLAAELALPQDPERAEELLLRVGDDLSLADRVEAVEGLSNILNTSSAEFADSVTARIFYRGQEALRRGDYEQAAEAWLDLVRKDRALGEDIGRQGCSPPPLSSGEFSRVSAHTLPTRSNSLGGSHWASMKRSA